jgi:hypothetical protein
LSRTAMFAKLIVTTSSPLFMSSLRDSLQISMRSHVALRTSWPRELSSSTSKPTLPLLSTSNSRPVLLHLCTVYTHYSDAPHLRTPACQYKDIPDWSVTVGRPEDRMTKDRVTLLTKIQKRYLVS